MDRASGERNRRDAGHTRRGEYATPLSSSVGGFNTKILDGCASATMSPVGYHRLVFARLLARAPDPLRGPRQAAGRPVEGARRRVDRRRAARASPFLPQGARAPPRGGPRSRDGPSHGRRFLRQHPPRPARRCGRRDPVGVLAGPSHLRAARARGECRPRGDAPRFNMGGSAWSFAAAPDRIPRIRISSRRAAKPTTSSETWSRGAGA